MRRNATLVLLVLLAAVGVVTAGVAAAGTGGGAIAPQASSPSVSSNATTLDVSASGSASADPDQAVVSVAVTASAASADDARAAVARNASSLHDALTDAGVGSDDVETTAYRVTERTEKTQNGTTTHYEAVHAFDVTVDDPSRAGDVLDAAVAGGANRVDGVHFTLSDATRADLRTEAIHDAMDDARSQADAAADAAGLTVSGLRSASVDGGSPPVMYTSAAASGSASDRTEIDNAPVSVSVSVQATYTAS
ncbi:hypothetical protein MBEHAL_1557 [Halarchaeum acidiphilum MH1-52-1]|uniref:Outer membrane protein n=1 Tax=Halarchaeum acidiphilum MH1-52-1 TaxID=1261545 RepID=U2YVK4_9EURY|nr:SIMPL domain-containing protein [Halarchaeum acidiphilum]GAD52797.1 hypothetical protein MBEHAL_1557 [Halarchaeum acidiphilum MH1-52-1]